MRQPSQGAWRSVDRGTRRPGMELRNQVVSDVRLSIALVSLAMLGYTGISANMLAMPADLFTKSVVGSIWGIASMGSGFGGMAFALLTGWLVDRYSYIPVFAVFGLIPLIAVFIIWVFLGPLIPPYKVECPTTLG